MTTTDDFEREWREGVNTQLKDLTKQSGQTAVTLERTIGAVTALENRMSHQESRPGNQREWGILWVMVAGVVVSIICGSGSLIVSLMTHITLH